MAFLGVRALRCNDRDAFRALDLFSAAVPCVLFCVPRAAGRGNSPLPPPLPPFSLPWSIRMYRKEAKGLTRWLWLKQFLPYAIVRTPGGRHTY